MSSNVSSITAATIFGAATGQQPAPSSDGAVGATADSGQPTATNPADLRLIIEDDKAAGTFVYKTVDRATGAVVQQFPREQIVRLREAENYAAGQVIKTRA
jgi:flagellar protein FlaG